MPGLQTAPAHSALFSPAQEVFPKLSLGKDEPSLLPRGTRVASARPWPLVLYTAVVTPAHKLALVGNQ